MRCSSLRVSTSSASPPHRFLSSDAVALLRRLCVPLPTNGLDGAPLLSTDSVPLLDLVLHLNDVYALSFWVLRSLVVELNRSDDAGDAQHLRTSPRLRGAELLAACEVIQHARDILDHQLGRLVLGPVLLACLLFYVDATAYDTVAITRDVEALLAPGGGSARYCMDDDDNGEDSEEEAEERETLGFAPAVDDAASHETGAGRGAAANAVPPTRHVSAVTRRRWQRERARVTSRPPPQSDVAVLFLNLTQALQQQQQQQPSSSPANTLHEGASAMASSVLQRFVADTITVPSQVPPAPSTLFSLPWLRPRPSPPDLSNEGLDASLWLWQDSPRAVAAVVRRGLDCVTDPPLSCAAAAVVCRGRQRLLPPRPLGSLLPSRASPSSSAARVEGGGAASGGDNSMYERSVFSSISVHNNSSRKEVAFAEYCEGLRRRHGGHRAAMTNDSDGLVLSLLGDTPPAPAALQVARSGSSHLRYRKRQRGSGGATASVVWKGGRNGFLRDPFARCPLPTTSTSLTPSSFSATSFVGSLGISNGAACTGPRCSRGDVADETQSGKPSGAQRQGSVSHWSDRPWQAASPAMLLTTRRKAALMHEVPLYHERTDDVPQMTMKLTPPVVCGQPRTLPNVVTLQLPIEVQRLCLEYLSPRYMRTASTVCATWFYLIRCSSPDTSYLARAHRASAAVTRAYTVFFQQQWGERSLPVTLLTSMHRFRFLLMDDDSACGAALVQAHWSRVRQDGELGAYVRQRLQRSPLCHLMDVQRNNHDHDHNHAASISAGETTHTHLHVPRASAEARSSSLPPLSATLFVFYVLCVIPTTLSLSQQSSSTALQVSENGRVLSAMRRLLRVWTTAFKWTDLWSGPHTAPRVSSLLVQEATRQQKLSWWLLAHPPTPPASAAAVRGASRSGAEAPKAGEDDEDFVSQLWAEWSTVQEVYRYSLAHAHARVTMTRTGEKKSD
jgi:hypothetical protein